MKFNKFKSKNEDVSSAKVNALKNILFFFYTTKVTKGFSGNNLFCFSHKSIDSLQNTYSIIEHNGTQVMLTIFILLLCLFGAWLSLVTIHFHFKEKSCSNMLQTLSFLYTREWKKVIRVLNYIRVSKLWQNIHASNLWVKLI